VGELTVRGVQREEKMRGKRIGRDATRGRGWGEGGAWICEHCGGRLSKTCPYLTFSYYCISVLRMVMKPPKSAILSHCGTGGL